MLWVQLSLSLRTSKRVLRTLFQLKITRDFFRWLPFESVANRRNFTLFTRCSACILVGLTINVPIKRSWSLVFRFSSIKNVNSLYEHLQSRKQPKLWMCVIFQVWRVFKGSSPIQICKRFWSTSACTTCVLLASKTGLCHYHRGQFLHLFVLSAAALAPNQKIDFLPAVFGPLFKSRHFIMKKGKRFGRVLFWYFHCKETWTLFRLVDQIRAWGVLLNCGIGCRFLKPHEWLAE